MPNLRPLYGNSIHPKKAVRTRIWHASLKGVREFGFAEAPDTDMFYNYTSHSRGSMPSILAPADSPSEEQFTLGNVAVELELEPRRANLLGADDVADGPDEADEQDEPADGADAPAADGAAAGKGGGAADGAAA